METWYEDTCVVCRTNDTNYLDDACDGCSKTWNNWADSTQFAKDCLAQGIDSYLGNGNFGKAGK